jgi:putative transcription factor
MPECSICGKKSHLVRAKIEGALVKVCNQCSVLGEVIPEAEQPKKKATKPLEITTIDPSFAVIIKIAREKKGLSREELANKISERVNIIERVEHGMQPTKQLAQKLEKSLEINLLDFSVDDIKIQKKSGEELTFGEIAELKVKKKK